MGVAKFAAISAFAGKPPREKVHRTGARVDEENSPKVGWSSYL